MATCQLLVSEMVGEYLFWLTACLPFFETGLDLSIATLSWWGVWVPP